MKGVPSYSGAKRFPRRAERYPQQETPMIRYYHLVSLVAGGLYGARWMPTTKARKLNRELRMQGCALRWQA